MKQEIHRMKSDARCRIEVVVSDGRELNGLLDKAVDTLIATALERKKNGILVTRHDGSRYTVELTDEVPYGLTHERSI